MERRKSRRGFATVRDLAVDRTQNRKRKLEAAVGFTNSSIYSGSADWYKKPQRSKRHHRTEVSMIGDFDQQLDLELDKAAFDNDEEEKDDENFSFLKADDIRQAAEDHNSGN